VPTEDVEFLARLQHGVFTVAQARDLGVPSSVIAYRRRSGRWATVHTGVVRLAGHEPTFDSNLVAVMLAIGQVAVVSGRSAARVHGLDGYTLSETVEVTTPRATRRRLTHVVVHSSFALGRLDLVDHRLPAAALLKERPHVGAVALRSFRVTSATRTLIDLAATESEDRLAAAVDSAVRLGLTSPAFLRRRVTQLRGSGRSGIRTVDAVLLDAGGHSWLERRFLALLRRAGLPRPRTQVVFRDDGVTFARVDFLYDVARVVIEVSGRVGHVSEPDRRKDARRRNQLQAAGMTVLEFVTRDVVREPDYVVACVAAALARAAT
jgi:very-short-patch-repair endonuclease